MFLIIDTSSERSLIIKASKKNFSKNVFGTDFDHSEKLLIEVEKILNGQLRNLEGIAVISGPGSYTGLRVGIATANALGYSLNLPVVEINKLEWLAYCGIENSQEDIKICSVIFALHNNIFASMYNYSGDTLKQVGDFFSGKINTLLEKVKLPTFFAIENNDNLQGQFNENTVKNKLGDKFLNVEYLYFYSDKAIEILVKIALIKFDKEKKYRIIKPLYIQKPKITYSKNKKI
jgi:tRNA threonylcarbamoyladenosine biosynthesis protein TsaB